LTRSTIHTAAKGAALPKRLLRQRICDLRLSLDASPLRACVDELYSELTEAGFIHFRPTIYLGDEWFSPDGVPAISMPFYLANRELMALERDQLKFVEGESTEECMQLLRHEAGHCFDHAWKISSRSDFRRVFGTSKTTRYTPDRYRADSTSRDFVRHLPDNYAQSHPDEDFAETFAVWLAPKSRWQSAYANWPGALRKLEYVDQLVHSLAPSKPIVTSGPTTFAAHRLTRTLAALLRPTE